MKILGQKEKTSMILDSVSMTLNIKIILYQNQS